MFFSLFLIVFIVCFIAWVVGGFVFHVAGGADSHSPGRRSHLLDRAFCTGPSVGSGPLPCLARGGAHGAARGIPAAPGAGLELRPRIPANEPRLILFVGRLVAQAARGAGEKVTRDDRGVSSSVS